MHSFQGSKTAKPNPSLLGMASGRRLASKLGTAPMSSTLNVRFLLQPGHEHSYVSRIRNFAEDLDRRLQAEQSGSVQNPDSAVELVAITIHSGRLAGHILSATRAALKRHNLFAEAKLERT